MEYLLQKIRDHIKDLVKISVQNDGPHRTHLTWKISPHAIHMYDCGESYATVASLFSFWDLLEEVQKGISENTKHVVLNYTDSREEVIHFRG